MKMLNLKNLVLILILFCALPIAANSQISALRESRTANFKQTVTLTKEQAIAKLLAEYKAAVALINANNEQINRLERQLALEQENNASLTRSYQAATTEIAALRTANETLCKAVEMQQDTIGYLNLELEKSRASGKKWKKRALSLGGILVAAILTKTL